MNKKECWFADGFTNNSGCGYVVCNGSKEIQAENTYSPGYLTNNEAEYEGVYNALILMDRYSILYSDSQLVVYQISGKNRCNYQRLEKYRDKCRKLIEDKDIVLQWIPRERNLAGKICQEREKYRNPNK